MDNLLDYLTAANSIVVFIGILFMVYRTFRDPDIKADKEIGMSAVACNEKHKRIDEIIIEIKNSIQEMNQTFALFRQNDFHHIEENTARISQVMGERLAKLEGQNNTVIQIMTQVLNKLVENK